MGITNRHSDDMWAASGLPDDDLVSWREVTSYRTTMPDVAIELAAAGLTPKMIADAREEPLYLDALLQDVELAKAQWKPGSSTPRSESHLITLTLLADETDRWHEAGRESALQVRQEALTRLTDQREDNPGWTFDSAGELIGVSKQRARKIVRTEVVLRTKPRPRPATRRALEEAARRAGLGDLLDSPNA